MRGYRRKRNILIFLLPSNTRAIFFYFPLLLQTKTFYFGVHVSKTSCLLASVYPFVSHHPSNPIHLLQKKKTLSVSLSRDFEQDSCKVLNWSFWLLERDANWHGHLPKNINLLTRRISHCIQVSFFLNVRVLPYGLLHTTT